MLALIVAAPIVAAGPASAASARPAHYSLALAPRHPAALAAYARSVTTPGSPRYRQYLTVAQFARRFGRGRSELVRARARLSARGLTVDRIAPNGLSVEVSGPAVASPRARRSGAAAPPVAHWLDGLVQGVIGAQTAAPHGSVIIRRPRRSPAVARAAAQPSALLARDALAGVAGPRPCPAASSLAAASGGYTADQIASAYGLSGQYALGDEGRGVTIAVYELGPFSPADVAAYQSCYGTAASVTTVPVDGGAGAGPGNGEAAMDVEQLIGLAPQATIRVYEGPATGAGAYDTYSRIVSDDSAQVISTSWGMCEALEGAAPAAAENALFQEAAVQGQSVVAATGDQGSDDCGDGQRSVDDPASQPWVTAVGATSRRGATDVVWNNALGATGGGVSTLWGRPFYQARLARTQAAVGCGTGGHACRELPDISVDGDPATGDVAYYRGAWVTVGGTSIAAPTVAALTALAEASPGCGGRRIGFLNPLLYDSAATRPGDVTLGANGYGGVPGFAAGPGYDMASGLGVPTAALGAALCRGTRTTAARA